MCWIRTFPSWLSCVWLSLNAPIKGTHVESQRAENIKHELFVCRMIITNNSIKERKLIKNQQDDSENDHQGCEADRKLKKTFNEFINHVKYQTGQINTVRDYWTI